MAEPIYIEIVIEDPILIDVETGQDYYVAPTVEEVLAPTVSDNSIYIDIQIEEPILLSIQEEPVLYVRASQVGGGVAIGIGEEFETVSKNLKSYNYNLNFQDGILNSIVYLTGGGTIVKTFGYTDGLLTRITLSGDLPDGIDLIKTLDYTAGELTTVTYS